MDNQRGLFSVDIQTGDARALMNPIDTYVARWADWSADGNTIYYSVERYDLEADKGPRIIARDAESGHEEVVFSASGPALMVPGNIALSPDRRRIVFVLSDEQQASVESRRPLVSLMIVDVTGGEPLELHRFGPDEPDPGQMSWTPDGRWVLFRSTRSHPLGRGELWRVQEAVPQVIYEVPSCVMNGHIFYDLVAGRYVVSPAFNEEREADYLAGHTGKVTEKGFEPSDLRKSGRR